jgi:microcystin-dependent protein
MGEPYVGEIRMFAGNFAPAGWMLCQGQTLAISENDTLFNLIGTTYGGDGQETFNLPDLQSRVPIHMGTAKSGTPYTIGQNAGTEQETLTVQQIPAHTHPVLASSNIAAQTVPTAQVAGKNSGASNSPFGTDQPLSTFPAQAIGPAGGSQPHENDQPFLCINFIISLFGVYPSPS